MRPMKHLCRRWVGCLSSLFLASMLTSNALAQLSAIDQQRKNRADQFRSMQNVVKSMQPLDAKRMDQVFQIQVEEKHLICTPRLPEVKNGRLGQYRLDIEGFNGPTYCQITINQVFARGVGGKIVAQPNPKPTQTFSLISYELPDPDSLTTLSIQSYPTYFHVEKNTQLNDGHWMVRLMEQRNPNLPDGGTVQLWVNQYGGGVAIPLNINIQEPDFPTLLRQHPDEIEQYIRPLLSQLGQEQIFAPDFRVAWQVLADYWPADPAVARQVSDLIPNLASADFRQRDQALAALIRLERAGAAVLLHIDRTGFSAEQNLLIDRALAPFAQLPLKQSQRLRADKSFLIDCLYSEDATIRKTALQQLSKVTGRDDLLFDGEASPAERSNSIRVLRRSVLHRSTTQPVAASQPASTTQPTFAK